MLSDFVLSELFAFLMVFCRIGSAMMVLPGFGEVFVLPRARLMLALAVSFVLTPMLSKLMPEVPVTIGGLIAILAVEILIGVFLGFLVRVLVTAIHTAGTIMATQSGLANAMMFDFTMSGQTTPINNLLTFFAIVLIFTMDLHHLMLGAVIDSYNIFSVAQSPPALDMAYSVANYVNRTFYVAFRLSAPFIIVTLVLNLGAGVLSRLMPTFQVFFIMMPAQILVTFLILIVALPAMMLYYLSHIEDGLSNLLTSM